MPMTYDYKKFLKAIDYFYIKGLNYSETARAIGVPTMTVIRWMEDFDATVSAIHVAQGVIHKSRLDK